MHRIRLWIIVIIVLLIASTNCLAQERTAKMIKLPKPSFSGKISVEEAIFGRKSIRNYKSESLTINEISQLLWAAGGVTCDGITRASRSYPSAGGAYPLEIYLVVGEVEGVPAGMYQYNHKEHAIVLIKEGDLRPKLTTAALGQGMIRKAPISLVFTAIYGRTTRGYGERGERYVHMDVGHAGQNVHLQAEALGLGTVVIGAFQDEQVKDVLGLEDEDPLYIMPVGKKQ